MTTESELTDGVPSGTVVTPREEDMFFSSLSRLPVIVILGATGTGKSKLAINLAKRFNGEIISADSMQMYKGLDILTNKVTVEEMNGVPHHMIGIIDSQVKYDVVRFQTEAVPIVDLVDHSREQGHFSSLLYFVLQAAKKNPGREIIIVRTWNYDLIQRILLDGKIPFLVGGTNYYIESLLWKVLIQSSCWGGESNISRKRKFNDEAVSPNVAAITDAEDSDHHDNEILKYLMSRNGDFVDDDKIVCNWTSLELYDALQLVDPERVQRIHPNDRRKILRSLQVRFQTGRKHSELIEQQKKEGATVPEQDSNRTSHLGGPLRYPNSFCFWIQAPKTVLDERINLRVDDMVKIGLKSEINNYIDNLREESCDNLDFTKGILQSIGFKEFQEYLQLAPNERETENAKVKFCNGVDLLKIATRQYAKRQLQWIRQRFLRPTRRQVPPVYWLDGSVADSDVWNRSVVRVAETIVEAHLLNQIELVPLIKERLVPQINEEVDDLLTRTCPVCVGRVFVGNIQWNEHMTSSRHKRVLCKQNKLQKLEQLRKDIVIAPKTNDDLNEDSIK